MSCLNPLARGGTWIAYDAYGLGVILDDGIAPPQEDIFKDGFETQ